MADNLSKFSQNSKKMVVLAKIHNMFAGVQRIFGWDEGEGWRVMIEKYGLKQHFFLLN